MEVSRFMPLSIEGHRILILACFTGREKSWLNLAGTASASNRAGISSAWMMLSRAAYLAGSTLITRWR
eukprot:2476781-Ditylum_brightwellii.AAC.1